MWGPGGASCIIRWLCHLPTGYLAFTGISLQDAALRVPDMDDFPNGANFVVGLQLVGIVGTITFAWNFFMFGASPFAHGNLLGMVGVVDMILAICIIIGVAEQSRFLPGSYGKCHGAGQLNSTPDGRNFFVIASSDASGQTPYDVCHDMIQNWAFAIAISIVYLFCALLNLMLGFGDTGCRGRAEYRGWGFPRLDFDIGFVGSFLVRVFDLARSLTRGAVGYLRKSFQREKAETAQDDLESVPLRKQQSWDEEDAVGTAGEPSYDEAVPESPKRPASLGRKSVSFAGDAEPEVLGFADRVEEVPRHT